MYLLAPVRVGPQLRIGGLLAQAFRLGPHGGRVEDRLYAGERRRQCRDLLGGIKTCHAMSLLKRSRALVASQTRYPALA